LGFSALTRLRRFDLPSMMTPVTVRPHFTLAFLEQIATRIVFFIAGCGTAAWALLMSFAKACVEIDDGVHGLIQLCPGIITTEPGPGQAAADQRPHLADQRPVIHTKLTAPARNTGHRNRSRS
jgi:hypothetical protein